MNHTKKYSIPDSQKQPPDLNCLAALFERSFSIDWLQELTGLKASQILFDLEEGVRERWLKQVSPGVYFFSDIERKQAFAGKLSDKEKSFLNGKIAELLLDGLPGDEKILSAVPHLLATVNNIDMCHLLLKGGDLNLKAFRTEEAVRCYFKILEDLSGIDGKEADSLFVSAAIWYSKLSLARDDMLKVSSMLLKAMKRAKRSGKNSDLAILKMHSAKNEWILGNGKKAHLLFNEGWAMAQKIGNPKLLRAATAFRIFFFFWQGRYTGAISTYEASVADVEMFPKGQFSLQATIMVGFCYAYCGESTQGLGMMDTISADSFKRGDRYLYLFAEQAIGCILRLIGMHDEAIKRLEGALKDAEGEHTRWVKMSLLANLASLYYHIGDEKKAMATVEKYLHLAKQARINVVPLWEISWAMEQGKLPQLSDLSIAREVKRYIKSEDINIKGVAYRYRALLERKDGASDETIIRSLKSSMKFLEESGHQIELAYTQMELSRQYIVSGRKEKAEEMAGRAYRLTLPINDALFPDDLRHLVKESIREQNLLKEIMRLGQELVTIRDNRALVQHIISTTNRITGAERGAIFFINDHGDQLKPELRASKGLTLEAVNHHDFAYSMRMIKKVAKTGKGLLELNHKKKHGGGDKFIRSRIGVPMIIRDKVWGVLYLDNRLLSSVFKEADLKLLAYFAAMAAIAMDNAMAYEEINMQRSKLKDEKHYYEERHYEELYFEDIIGESKSIKNVLSQVDQVAPTETTVLITGETGVGKELIASAIHRNSRREKKPFIRINLNVIPYSLVPSELFGHEKGAFTGAVQKRIGRFELADGGTLFLDEIGDLPPDIQVRLLRVLQNKEFERLGGVETLRSDFRLIAATNRDLEAEVRAGNFREDFFFRLNVFPIHVPPLRERVDDIPLLANYFLKIHATRANKPFNRIDPGEMERLIRYGWPGNVRELDNVIERGVILSSGRHFSIPELNCDIVSPDSQEHQHLDTWEENERKHVLRVLEKTNWKVSGKGGASKILNIKPQRLAYRMKILGIERPKKHE